VGKHSREGNARFLQPIQVGRPGGPGENDPTWAGKGKQRRHQSEDDIWPGDRSSLSEAKRASREWNRLQNCWEGEVAVKSMTDV